jgi:hypothetical protein
MFIFVENAPTYDPQNCFFSVGEMMNKKGIYFDGKLKKQQTFEH